MMPAPGYDPGPRLTTDLRSVFPLNCRPKSAKNDIEEKQIALRSVVRFTTEVKVICPFKFRFWKILADS